VKSFLRAIVGQPAKLHEIDGLSAQGMNTDTEKTSGSIFSRTDLCYSEVAALDRTNAVDSNSMFGAIESAIAKNKNDLAERDGDWIMGMKRLSTWYERNFSCIRVFAAVLSRRHSLPQLDFIKSVPRLS